ncbi:MAG: hypothetical protein MI924_36910 [Chloroflexales bacterium]|nr:hypothetical protein [Chloroflexales bacterium]
MTERAHDCTETHRAGLLSHQSGKGPTPQKRPETDAIFAHRAQVNRAADTVPDTLRIAMDAKATEKEDHLLTVARVGRRRLRLIMMFSP